MVVSIFLFIVIFEQFKGIDSVYDKTVMLDAIAGNSNNTGGLNQSYKDDISDDGSQDEDEEAEQEMFKGIDSQLLNDAAAAEAEEESSEQL